MARIREWVTEARCIECEGIYKIDSRYPLQKRCKPCSKAYRKRVKLTDRLEIISFFIFPLGILMYFIWKDKKPHLAKPVLKAALIPIYILGGLFLFFFLLYIIVKLV